MVGAARCCPADRSHPASRTSPVWAGYEERFRRRKIDPSRLDLSAGYGSPADGPGGHHGLLGFAGVCGWILGASRREPPSCSRRRSSPVLGNRSGRHRRRHRTSGRHAAGVEQARPPPSLPEGGSGQRTLAMERSDRHGVELSPTPRRRPRSLRSSGRGLSRLPPTMIDGAAPAPLARMMTSLSPERPLNGGDTKTAVSEHAQEHRVLPRRAGRRDA